MELGLRDKVVVITGAGTGIGRATAQRLATEGCRVAIGARSAEDLERLAVEIRATGAETITRAGDLVTSEGVVGLVQAAHDTFGGVDALVACVGSTPLGEFDDLDDQLWQRAFEMKFLATVRAFRAVLPALRRRGGGRVVILTGNAAHAAMPSFVTSGAINAALGNLVANLARQYAAEHIGVNAVSPGPVDTGRYQELLRVTASRVVGDPSAAESVVLSAIPDRRIGTPDEVAALVAYLLSPLAGHIIGTTVVIDGGQTWLG